MSTVIDQMLGKK